MMLNKTFHLLLLSLIPIFGFSQANSQYPDSGNKIRLGFQTTGDGLIWRDTQPNVGVYQPINNKAAWIVLDTVNNKFYHYKNSTWTLAGGQDIDTANLIATKYDLGLKLSIADTENILTPYWRSGRFLGVLPVDNGGTGQTTLSAAGINTGTGTINFLPKYTAGTTFGNSNASDDGDTFRVNVQGKFNGLSGSRILTLNAPTNGGSLTFEVSGAAFADMGSYPSIIGGGSATDFIFNTRANSSITFSTSNVPRIAILSEGNVGIGTADPGAKLNIVHTASTSIPALQVASSASLINNDIVRFKVNGLTNGFRMFQDASSVLNYTFQDGKVGIGTTSPSTLFNVSGYQSSNWITTIDNTGTSGHNLYFGYNDGTSTTYGLYITGGRGAANQLDFAVVNKFYVNGNGNVGIGTASPQSQLHIYNSSGTATLRLHGTRTADGSVGVLNFNNITDLTFGYIIGSIGVDRSGFDNSGAMIFSTANGASTPTEHMRITSTGNVGIGTTSPKGRVGIGDQTDIVSTYGLTLGDAQSSIEMVASSFNSGYGAKIEQIDPADGSTYTRIFGRANTTTWTQNLSINNSTGAVTINNLGTGTVYSNSGVLSNTPPSDERLKNNITNISWGLNDILKLRPVSFNWKDDRANQGKQFGFIAQEVHSIMPEAIKIFGEDFKYLGLEKDAIYATLVKAVQELSAEIDILKQEIINLKNK